MFTMRKRWSAGLRPGLPTTITSSPGFNVSRVTPCRPNWPPAPQLHGPRLHFALIVGELHVPRNECGLRYRNCTRFSVDVTFWSSKYVAAKE